MTGSGGGFYSSLDADSEGEEGTFYIWKKEEVDRILGDQSESFCDFFNITGQGNFEHNTNIPNITTESNNAVKITNSIYPESYDLLNQSRQKLFDVRAQRARPFTDDKILVSWNGMMISGLVHGYMVTQDNKYRHAAVSSAEFIIQNMFYNDELLHSYRDGKISLGPFLEDYAFFIKGLIDLYEIEHNYERIKLASRLAKHAVRLFGENDGHLYLTPEGNDNHFMRPKDISDGALPSPGSILIQSLLKLSEITGDKEFARSAEKSLDAISSNIAGKPHGLISAVTALDNVLSDKIEIVIVGRNEQTEFLNEIYEIYIPHRVLVISGEGAENTSLLTGRETDGPTSAYICRNFTCRLPATTIDIFKEQLKELLSHLDG